MSIDSNCASVFHVGLLWQRVLKKRVYRKPRLSVIHVIFYFGHGCLKLNLVLIPIINGNCATQNVKPLRNSSQWTLTY